MQIPNELRLNRITVAFTSRAVADAAAETRAQLAALKGNVRPGMRIALAVGSRGIDRLADVVRGAAAEIKSWGAAPFIVPAMGSHGGATAEGQEAVLASYGITEQSVGAPILSSMEVASLGPLPGHPAVHVYMDKHAHEADFVIAVNRVKAHTDFHGEHESGIAKMLVIGLGKHAQALACHAFLADGLRTYTPLVAEEVIRSGKVLGAVGLVEDGHDQLSIIRAVPADQIMRTDAELLLESKRMMPRLPFHQCDVLLLLQMGKNISGTGMDTNVIGRVRIHGQPDQKPDITCVCVFDLTPESHGNALGVGLADIVPQRLADAIDWEPTYQNVLTSRFLERGFLPIVRKDDREVVAAALRSSGRQELAHVRLALARNTLHISELFVSDALLAELEGRPGIEVLARGVSVGFDGSGAIVNPF